MRKKIKKWFSCMIAAAMVMSTVNLPVDTFASDFSDGVEISVEDEIEEDTPDVTADGDEVETDVFSDEEKENIEDVDISDKTENEISDKVETEDEEVFSDHMDEIVEDEAVAVGISQSEFNNKLNELRGRYPNYSVWNDWFDGGHQCFGFARLIGYNVFGSMPSTWGKTYSINDVKAGDLVQYGNTSGSGHTIFVTNVSGDTITFVDCNGNGNYSNGTKVRSNGVKWDNTIKKGAKIWNKYSFSYIISSPGIGPDPTPTPSPSHVDVGTNFYAYLINTATWLHATNDGGNVNVKKLDYSPNQIWYFELQSDGSYKITSAEDDRCMEVHNFESANGTNVEMNGWNGNTAQRWFIYGSSGAYKLKAACGENALDMKGGPEAATDGTNLNMWEDNGTDAQKFSIWKLDDIKDTIRNKTIELEYSECVYTGKECTPEISVKKDSTKLVKDTDYRVSYENNVKVGTATVTILGIGKYTGRIKKQFKINKASQNLTVSIDKTDLAIGETAQIKTSGQGKITYKSSAEDKVTVSSTGVITGKQAGDATITITASGTENYNSAAKELLIHVLKDCVGNKHTWDSGKITKQPTCTEDGKKTYTCTTCGTVRTEILPATGHTWDNGKITREATCITDGQKTYTCTICKNTKTESISKTGHKEVKDVAVSATCENTGKTEGSHCSVCGTIIKKQETIPATGHTWDSGKVTKQPTCTTDGQKTYTCTICKKTKTENISKTGHKEVKDAAVSATCENTGKTEGSHCSVCNTVLKKQETLPATGHTWDGGKVTKAATCTTDGEKNYTCTTCHKTRTESIPKTGHTEVKDAATPATCENTGKTEGSHCSVCNTVLKKQETLPALGHTWDSGKVTKVATCTTDGEKNYTCTTCHKTRIESVPKTGHTEVKDAATPATCEDAGKTEGSHCSICGTVIKKQETIPALGHTWDSGKVTKAATCTTDGEKTYTCTICQKTRTETIPATGHTEITKFAKKATCETEGYTGDIYCNNCGEMLKEGKVIEKLSHDWKQTGTKKATCTASGENTYTCIRCNKTKTEQIPATGHKWSTWWKLSDATVFKPQKQQRTCSLCHISQTRDYGSKLKSVMRTSCSSILLKTKQTTNALTVSGMAKGDYVSRVISGNTRIVRVTRYTKDGKIQLTAQGRTGNTNVTIRLAGGAVKRINVKVQSGAVKTTAIRVSFTKATLKAGTKKTISTTVTPSTSQEKVTYTTSNKNIATVTANGIITARKRGTAKITVKSGSKKQSITITVK